MCEWAEANGWLAPKLQWLSQTGWPDRTFIRKSFNGNGYIVAFIEFKKPGGRLAAKQKYWIDIIASFGIPVCVQETILAAQFWLHSIYVESARND